MSTLPRLGFLGLGWIGRSRMAALAEAGGTEIIGLADPDRGAAEAAALMLNGRPSIAAGLEELLSLELDGLVIATPSALHAEQAIAALERGVAVFCQKPLARNLAETDAVLAAARRCDRPLGVDLSYRRTLAAATARRALTDGAVGRAFAADLVFHNAYGPDKPWFLDRALAGGGCVIDLATHMLDLVLWLTGERDARVDAARLLRRGEPLARADAREVEDYAIAQLSTGGGLAVRLACSWFLPAGTDCVFECTLYGTEGSLFIVNVDGSYYDFRLERRWGTARETLVEPPDEWGGRALCDWAGRVSRGERFDAVAGRELAEMAATIDAIYTAGGRDG